MTKTLRLPVRSLLKFLFLRGKFRQWWISRKAKKLDEAYLMRIIRGQEDEGEVRASSASGRRPTDSILRRVLFIADCMWEDDQLFPELRKICEIDVLDLHEILARAVCAAEAVVEAIRRHAALRSIPDPDLVFFYARPAILSEEAFDIIRKRWSCPVFGMNLDDRVEFFPLGVLKSGNDNYARWTKAFDLNLTSSRVAVDWYERQGAPVRYMPQGFRPDPRFLHPPDSASFSRKLSFVGSRKPERDTLIAAISSRGMDIEIYGRGWPDGKWLADPASIFRTTQINLGIGFSTASARIANAKGRDVECPGIGACYLTTYHWELAEMFEIGKEILCYRNSEELVEMLTFYLPRPGACLEIARAAHARALAEHTWENRLRGLFLDVGFRFPQS